MGYDHPPQIIYDALTLISVSGFEGMTMSDWIGTYSTTEAIKAGLDLEMPCVWTISILCHASY